ncbi:MAG: hypothetical protein QOF62_2866 [Pyrinomonadaceae bacterium]|nr:hypothetical protein [Pyrinomonadaceae bacterium]
MQRLDRRSVFNCALEVRQTSLRVFNAQFFLIYPSRGFTSGYLLLAAPRPIWFHLWLPSAPPLRGPLTRLSTWVPKSLWLASPQILFIIFDAVLFQNIDVLLLKRYSAMVLFLIQNIVLYPIDVPRTDRKCRVARLPCKLLLSYFSVYPLRGVGFQIAQKVIDTMARPESYQQVYVVFYSSYRERHTIQPVDYPTEVRMQSGAPFN